MRRIIFYIYVQIQFYTCTREIIQIKFFKNPATFLRKNFYCKHYLLDLRVSNINEIRDAGARERKREREKGGSSKRVARHSFEEPPFFTYGA